MYSRPAPQASASARQPHFFPTAATTLIIPGFNGSGADHWQTAWERERTDCRRADLGDWEDPRPEQWVQRLDEEIQDQPSPVILVAHSLGCMAVALWSQHYLQSRRDLVKGALLVAPCDPEAATLACLQRFAPIPRGRIDMRTILVASTNDQYASLTRSKQMAKMWGSEFINVGAQGHINAQSHLGAWAFGQTLLGLLQGRVVART